MKKPLTRVTHLDVGVALPGVPPGGLGQERDVPLVRQVSAGVSNPFVRHRLLGPPLLAGSHPARLLIFFPPVRHVLADFSVPGCRFRLSVSAAAGLIRIRRHPG